MKEKEVEETVFQLTNQIGTFLEERNLTFGEAISIIGTVTLSMVFKIAKAVNEDPYEFAEDFIKKTKYALDQQAQVMSQVGDNIDFTELHAN